MSARHLVFPLSLGPTGRLQDAQLPRYVQGLVEAVLFTNPGERVNRPQFGCGLSRIVFEAATPDALSATRHLVERNLQVELAGMVEHVEVELEMIDAELHVLVGYRLPGDAQRREARFVR